MGAIDPVSMDINIIDAPVFDLNGVRHDATGLRPGIYVQHGRKFMAR